MKNLPTLLTLFRLACAPLVAGLILWAAHLTYVDTVVAGLIYAAALIVFALAALTDWIDGYLARALKAVTPLGAALDHSADKVLVTCALVALAYAALPLHLVAAAVIILGRDVAIAGLREGLSAAGRQLPVNSLGKFKAAAEMAGVAAFLAFKAAVFLSQSLELAQALTWAAAILIWIGAGLALISAAVYGAAALKPAN